MEKAWTDAKQKAEDDANAVKNALGNDDLKALRQDVLDEAKAWQEANDTLTGLVKKAAEAKEAMDEAEDAMKKEILECQVKQYDSYRATLEEAIQTRVKDLQTIKELIENQETPAVGTAGARCEKALSNGTMRPRKALGRETVCDEGLCCGAARVW